MRKKKIVLVCGLSGSGKTTLGGRLQHHFETLGIGVKWLDGDVVRTTFSRDLGYSRQDRLENAKRIASIVKDSLNTYDAVVVSAIAPYEEARGYFRSLSNAEIQYYEVFLTCELSLLVRRDKKGLYKRATLPKSDPDFLPSLSGVSDPFEVPRKANITIDTGNNGIEETYNQAICIIAPQACLETSPQDQLINEE